MTDSPPPTVGRIVHYHPHAGTGLYAAIVTRVDPAIDAGAIEVTAFVPGSPVPLALKSRREPGVEPGQWSWPPRLQPTCQPAAEVDLDQVASGLLEVLGAAGGEWGPAGVASVAARLAGGRFVE